MLLHKPAIYNNYPSGFHTDSKGIKYKSVYLIIIHACVTGFYVNITTLESSI